MGYKFKKGSRFYGDANAVYNALESIREENEGKLEPPQIVETAKNKKSPLHSQFEWNNSIAGEKWRLYQARLLVRAIIYEDDSNKPNKVFINIVTDGEQYYQNINVATMDEFKIAKDRLLKQAQKLTHSAAEITRFAKTHKQKKFAQKANKSTQAYLKEIRR
jgi:hypothetical protein